MKKGLLAVLLAIALAAPIFASEKGDINIVGKLGVAVNPKDGYVDDNYDSVDYYKRNPALSVAVEGLYYVLPELPVGLGINYQFNSEFTKYENCEDGSTNIYLTVKPTAKIDSNIFTALYLIGQIGYGLYRLEGDGWEDCEVDSGLYWGLGAGTEIMNDFIFEFVFSTNNWTYKWDDGYTFEKQDMKGTALTLFAGYKFNI